MGHLYIRKAVIDDGAIVALLGRVTFTETFGKYFNDPDDLSRYYDETFSVEKIRSGIEKDNNAFWIAFYDEIPVGYAKLKRNAPSLFVPLPGKVSQLQKIYVLKDFHAKRIGLGLIEILLQEVVRMEGEYIWLSVLASNIKATSFYEKMGFIVKGQHGFQIGKENFKFIVMGRPVKSKCKERYVVNMQ